MRPNYIDRELLEQVKDKISAALTHEKELPPEELHALVRFFYRKDVAAQRRELGITDRDGYAFPVLAAGYGHAGLMPVFHAAGIDLASADLDLSGFSPLTVAAFKNHTAVVDAIHALGVPDRPDKYGRTAEETARTFNKRRTAPTPSRPLESDEPAAAIPA